MYVDSEKIEETEFEIAVELLYATDPRNVLMRIYCRILKRLELVRRESIGFMVLPRTSLLYLTSLKDFRLAVFINQP